MFSLFCCMSPSYQGTTRFLWDCLIRFLPWFPLRFPLDWPPIKNYKVLLRVCIVRTSSCVLQLHFCPAASTASIAPHSRGFSISIFIPSSLRRWKTISSCAVCCNPEHNTMTWNIHVIVLLPSTRSDWRQRTSTVGYIYCVSIRRRFVFNYFLKNKNERCWLLSWRLGPWLSFKMK